MYYVYKQHIILFKTSGFGERRGVADDKRRLVEEKGCGIIWERKRRGNAKR